MTGRAWAAVLMKAPVVQRGFFAASWSAGQLTLERPTPAQAGTAARVSTYYVKLWLGILDHPELVHAVLTGELTLHEAAAQREKFPRVPQPPAPSITKTSINLSTAMGLDAIIASVGDEILARILTPRLDRIIEYATAPQV
jgi:hypothetical protein